MHLYKSIGIIGLFFASSVLSTTLMSGTRVIHDPKVGLSQIYLKNQTESELHISAWISEGENNTRLRLFDVMPQKAILNKSTTMHFKIKSQETNKFKYFQESFYWFNIYEESTDKKIIPTHTKIKLFVRPERIGVPSYDSRLLKVKNNNGIISITNKSPFFVTVASLMLGNKEIKKSLGMLAPSENVSFMKQNNPNKTLTLKVINDSGHIKDLIYVLK